MQTINRMKATRQARFQSEWATTSITCRRSGYRSVRAIVIVTYISALFSSLFCFFFSSAAVRDGGAQWLDSHLSDESGENHNNNKNS